MMNRLLATSAVTIGLLSSPAVAGPSDGPQPLTLLAARVSIAGTSHLHPLMASTTDVRMSRLVLAPADGNRLLSAAKPGGVEELEIVIPAGSLSSAQEGADQHLHQALGVDTHPDITFRLLGLEPAAAAGRLEAVGVLTIAGVEREVAFEVKFAVNASTITVMGEVALLMTDYGLVPPTAMLGMIKADPTITVTFETVLGLPYTTF